MPWVQTNVAAPKKDGNVRICVDMRLPNEAIRRVRHPIFQQSTISVLSSMERSTLLNLISRKRITSLFLMNKVDTLLLLAPT